MSAVRTLLVDDHELFLAAAREAIERGNDLDVAIRFEVVATASDGSQVLPLVTRLRPQLVLLDLSLPRVDGLTVLELLHERHPDVTVVVLTANEGREHIRAALSRGAAGYILKTIHPADLAAALRQIVDESVYVPPPPTPRSAAAEARGLSPRELEVLALVARGLSNAAVARELFLTQQTIKFHLTNVYRKLGVENRTAALRQAQKLGFAANPKLEAHAAPGWTSRE
jgi:DNA-binding NarL/FixJ family response regulator